MQQIQTTDKNHRPSRSTGGFSLIEMLVVIAVIGIIAAIAVPSVSNINDSAKEARDQRNAQNLCAMHSGAQVAGVAFASSTKEGIFDELVGGVTAPDTGMNFKFGDLAEEEKTGALTYVAYDGTHDMLKYSADQGPVEEVAAAPPEPEPTPEPEPQQFPTEWVEVGVFQNAQVAGIVTQLQNDHPNWEVQYPYHSNSYSTIIYRELY